MRLRSYFLTSRGSPHVDDRRVLFGVIFIIQNGYAATRTAQTARQFGGMPVSQQIELHY